MGVEKESMVGVDSEPEEARNHHLKEFSYFAFLLSLLLPPLLAGSLTMCVVCGSVELSLLPSLPADY